MVNICLLRIKDRINIWEQVLGGKWRRFISLVITIFSIYGIIQSQIPTENEAMRKFFILPQWDWWIWALIFVAMFWIITLEGAYQLLRKHAPLNWIEKHLILHGKLPILPKYLQPLVNNYTDGEPISQDIEPITPSGQIWNSMFHSQRKEWEELVRWLGKDPQDLIDHMKMMLPKDPQLGSKYKPFERH